MLLVLMNLYRSFFLSLKTINTYFFQTQIGGLSLSDIFCYFKPSFITQTYFDHVYTVAIFGIYHVYDRYIIDYRFYYSLSFIYPNFDSYALINVLFYHSMFL